MSGASGTELTTPGAFVLQGGVPAIIGAVAQHAAQHRYKKVTLIVVNQPTVVRGTEVLGGIVFKAAGVGLQVLTAGAGTTDLRPELQEAVAGGASAVGVGGNVAFCSAFLRAYSALHVHLPKYVIATCLDPSILHSSLDEVLKGSWLAGAGTASATNDALYAAIVDKYAPGVNPNPNVSTDDFAGLLPVLSLAALMKDSGAPVSAAGILQRTETAENVVLPMSGGVVKVTCNGTAISILKSVCSSTTAIGVLGSGYTVSHVVSYDPSPLF